ncbi:MAG: ABC transporter permease [Candidatus Brocadiaceae bacterium]|nr:ABC transporter permease [Candidatus Brocadiaceae bacterium]
MKFKRLCIVFAFCTFFLYAGLMVSLVYFFKGSLFMETLFSERTLFSIRLSLLAATIATALSLFMAIPSAYALSRYNFMAKNMIDTILELPMIVSPAALGAMVLIFFTNPVGNWLQEHGVRFIFAVPGIILAQFVTTAGIATRLIKAAMDGIPRKYEDVASSLGASPVKIFFTITLPLSKNGIIAGGVLTWAKAVGEFGATVTIAGTMAMKTETIPTAIFMRLSSADIRGTVVLIFILITIGLGMLFGTRILLQKFAKSSHLQKL